MQHTLQLVEGPGAPSTYVLEHRTTVAGRGPSNDIVLDGPKVSKRHVLFTIEGDGRLLVEDLNSRNGVYVDEQKITETPLRPGAALRVGDCRFVYQKSESKGGSSGSDSAPRSGPIETGCRVLVSDGDGYFDAVPLRSECVYLGKVDANDVVLPGPDVSRRHAMLCYQDGSWELHDLESTNGTYIDAQAIDQASLPHGARFRIGRFLLAIEGPDAPILRDDLDADAARLFKNITGYLPWPTQLRLLAFLLAISALLVLLTALKYLGRL
jgi:pSer/pThr/pTyr-binding forkhead associated (FHA) protein